MPVIGQIMKAAADAPKPLSETLKPSPDMPVLVAKRCVRCRHKSSNCIACVEACPADAMRLVEGRIRLNVPSCTACGACAAACPTDALHMRRPLEADLAAQYEEAKKTGEFVFSCGYAAKKPGVRVNCTARVELSHFLKIAAEGIPKVRLVCGDCAKCPRASKDMNLKETAHTLELAVGEFDVPFTVSVERAPKEVDMSRRRWFGGIMRRTGSDTSSKPVPPDPAMLRIADEPDRRVPDSRRRFIDAAKVLAAKKPEKTDESFLGSLMIVPQIDNQKCTACGICETVCPTEALRVQKEDGRFTISAVKAHCTGCGLCRDICFMKAISFAQMARVADALKEEPEALCVQGAEKNDQAYSTWEDRISGMFSDVPIYRS